MTKYKHNIKQNVPIDVDIKIYAHADFEKTLANHNDLSEWIIMFGELICERDGYWSILRESWKSRISLPSATVAEERSARSLTRYHELKNMGDTEAADELLLASLTQSARAHLIRNGIYPASRPELPAQLRKTGEYEIADKLEELLRRRVGA